MGRIMRMRNIALLVVGLCVVSCHGTVASAPPSSPPRTTESNITALTTSLLEHSQFSHRPFDDALAGTLLDRYVDSLDGTHSVFLQSDIDEFAAYHATLAEATRGAGDTRAARDIFRRYVARLSQRAAYVTETLRTATFDFTGHDAYSFDREQAPRPRTIDDAHELWQKELRAEYLAEKLGDKAPAQIVRTLSDRAAHQVQAVTALRADDVLDLYLDTLAHVYDPHSDYLGHEQLENLSIAMNLSLVGIGATLESEDGYCTIHELVAGGPAARSGLLTPGDRIVAVKRPTDSAPIDVVGMPLSHTVDLIRGQKGSVVTLSIVPKSAGAGQPPKLVTLVRDAIKLEDQEARASIVDVPTSQGKTARVGVIDLPSFYADMGERGGERRSATADVARLLARLEAEHVQGVLLDLRHNPGGSLEEAINLTGLFIRTGPVVQTRDQRGDVAVGADKDPSIAYDGPLVLLTSRLSASASEILAGALQDYGRAVVGGDASTFGKGTVQNILPLARVMDKAGLAHAYDPGALKITTSKFYRPSGASTQLRGVASDIVLPSTTDMSEVNESTLKDALQWDAVAPTRYAHLGRVEPYLARLREKSAERVTADEQLAHVREDVVRLKQKLAAKSLSLNEAERRQEIAEAKTRDEARAVELAALDATQPVRREITLESLDPGGSPTAASNESSAKRAARGDAILHEGVRILADYTGLVAADR